MRKEKSFLCTGNNGWDSQRIAQCIKVIGSCDDKDITEFLAVASKTIREHKLLKALLQRNLIRLQYIGCNLYVLIKDKEITYKGSKKPVAPITAQILHSLFQESTMRWYDEVNRVRELRSNGTSYRYYSIVSPTFMGGGYAHNGEYKNKKLHCEKVRKYNG